MPVRLALLVRPARRVMPVRLAPLVQLAYKANWVRKAQPDRTGSKDCKAFPGRRDRKVLKVRPVRRDRSPVWSSNCHGTLKFRSEARTP